MKQSAVIHWKGLVAALVAAALMPLAALIGAGMRVAIVAVMENGMLTMELEGTTARIMDSWIPCLAQLQFQAKRQLRQSSPAQNQLY